MPPIILVLLQGLFLVLLYVFVARAVRAVVHDVRRSAAAARPALARAPAPARPVASSARRRRGRVRELVVHAPQGKPQVVPLDSAEVRLGRGQQCTVSLSDTYASELHARVYPSGDQWLVADMGSTNGTYLNRAKVTSPTPIQPGDQLAIGKTIVEVRR